MSCSDCAFTKIRLNYSPNCQAFASRARVTCAEDSETPKANVTTCRCKIRRWRFRPASCRGKLTRVLAACAQASLIESGCVATRRGTQPCCTDYWARTRASQGDRKSIACLRDHRPSRRGYLERPSLQTSYVKSDRPVPSPSEDDIFPKLILKYLVEPNARCAAMRMPI